MLSATRKCGNSAYSWKTIPTRRSSVGTVSEEEETNRSERKICPERTGSKPAIALKTVVLPQPDGPRRQRISPSRMEKETSLIAGRLGS